jgi:hypothetical protein
VPAVSPVIVIAGFVLIVVDLDLLPLAGLTILVGLLPVVRDERGSTP